MRKGSHQSEEAKQKISKSMIEVRKTINPMKGRTGDKHPNYGKPMSEEQKKKLSEAHKGKPSNRKGAVLSEETKKKISDSKKGSIPWNKGLKTGKSISPGVGGSGTWYEKSDGNNIWLRSEFELRVAIKLDELNIPWEYEPKAFDLGDSYYHPDFLINNTIWWEVKGKYPANKEKVIKFLYLYPYEDIKIMYERDIIMLEKLNEKNYNDVIKIGTEIKQVNFTKVNGD